MGKHIRALREARGLSQSQLGAPYFTRANISAIELGKIMPALKTLAHFADQMHLPIRELIPSEDVALNARYYAPFEPV